MATTPILIKLTQDGRRVEVIGTAICLEGKPEAEQVIEVSRHPNQAAIRRLAPEATHLAGRITLTASEAAQAMAALEAARAALAADPRALAQRIRQVTNEALKIRLDD